jgi:hypothetical protein
VKDGKEVVTYAVVVCGFVFVSNVFFAFFLAAAIC